MEQKLKATAAPRHEAAIPTNTPGKAEQHAAEEFTTIPGPLTMLLRALWWLAQGVGLVPLQHQTKKLIAGFGPYRKKITEEESARYWFGVRACNLGVVCGSGLGCLDFDDSAMFDSWIGAPGRAWVRDTLIEQTTRGYHVWFFTDGSITSGQDEFCEIKARGSVVMSAPSVAPSGLVYSVVNDAIPLRVSAEQILSLLSNRHQFESQPNNQVRPLTVSQITSGGALVRRVKREFAIYD